MWDLEKNSSTLLVGHTGQVFCVVFERDLLASGGGNYGTCSFTNSSNSLQTEQSVFGLLRTGNYCLHYVAIQTLSPA